MGIFKITNITNTSGKRDVKHNSILDIEYIDGMTKKTLKIRPGDTTYLTVPSLPISIQRFKLQNLLTVVQVDEAELAQSMNSIKPILESHPQIIVNVENTNEEKDNAARKASRHRISKTTDSEVSV